MEFENEVLRRIFWPKRVEVNRMDDAIWV